MKKKSIPPPSLKKEKKEKLFAVLKHRIMKKDMLLRQTLSESWAQHGQTMPFSSIAEIF